MIKGRKCNPISEREKLIGRRLSEIRNFLGYTQFEVARKLKIKRERLASYESGRAPVKAYIAFSFCRQYGVNERWLATGVNPRYPSFFYVHSWLYEVDPDELFSSVYDRLYSGKETGSGGVADLLNPEQEEHIRTMLKVVIDDSLKLIPVKNVSDYCLAILKSGSEFLKENGIKLYDSPFNGNGKSSPKKNS